MQRRLNWTNDIRKPSVTCSELDRPCVIQDQGSDAAKYTIAVDCAANVVWTVSGQRTDGRLPIRSGA